MNGYSKKIDEISKGMAIILITAMPFLCTKP